MYLEVLLADVPVGEIRVVGNVSTFRFMPSYVDMAERPVLGRWYEDRCSTEFADHGKASALPPFFGITYPSKAPCARCWPPAQA